MTILAGNRADVADFTPGVALGIAKFIRKGAAESLPSSTTLQNDDALTFEMEPGVTYEVDFTIVASGHASGDIKTAWSGPGDITGVKSCHGPASTTSTGWVGREDTNGSFSAHGVTTVKPYHLESNGSTIREWGIVSSATGGTFVFQWAQNSTNATATVISGSSYLKVTVVERP